ncbi:MAG: hypothetical protein ASARMPREDX12_004065 [Alectoria sarmentosa]|nr:MAG: hypothetical protein ASARMPREDX12_004065 [Alectoria sarmentosa]
MPYLPSEIRTMIVRSYGNTTSDLTHLWTTCRLVSTEFKEVVESIFVKYHLPSTTLSFAFSSNPWSVNQNGRHYPFEQTGEFRFLTISPQDTRKAVFSSGRSFDLLDHLGYLGVVRGRKYQRMLTRPRHAVKIADGVNDIHIPGMSVYSKRGTISFDWKALMSLFFAEEHLCQRILSSTAGMDLRPVSAMAHSWLSFAQGVDPIRHGPTGHWSRFGLAKRAARRIRLDHFHSSLVGEPWVMAESDVARENTYLRTIADYQRLIDEEIAERRRNEAGLGSGQGPFEEAGGVGSWYEAVPELVESGPKSVIDDVSENNQV